IYYYLIVLIETYILLLQQMCIETTVACEILNVVNDIFQNIDEASSEEHHFNWIRDDFYFSEVADSYDSEESDN
ncbi:Hypothetical predicted protein, partial [Paramuricea clavata]